MYCINKMLDVAHISYIWNYYIKNKDKLNNSIRYDIYSSINCQIHRLSNCLLTCPTDTNTYPQEIFLYIKMRPAFANQGKRLICVHLRINSPQRRNLLMLIQNKSPRSYRSCSGYAVSRKGCASIATQEEREGMLLQWLAEGCCGSTRSLALQRGRGGFVRGSSTGRWNRWVHPGETRHGKAREEGKEAQAGPAKHRKNIVTGSGWERASLARGGKGGEKRARGKRRQK